MTSPNPGDPQAVDAAFVVAKAKVIEVAQSHRKLISAMHNVVSTVDSLWYLQGFRAEVDSYGKMADSGIAAAIAAGKAVNDTLTSFSTKFYPAFLDPQLSADDKLALANDFNEKCEAIRATGNMDEQTIQSIRDGLSQVYVGITNLILTLRQDIQNQINADNAAIATDETDIASLQIQLQTASTASKGGCASAGIGIALCLIPGCEVIGAGLLVGGAITYVAADSDAAIIAGQIKAKTEDELSLRMDISSLVSDSGGLLTLLGDVNSAVATLKKQIEASDQLLRYVLSQIAALSDDIKLVIALGKSVFEPGYLSFLQADEKLMQKQTDALSDLFQTYFSTLEAPEQ